MAKDKGILGTMKAPMTEAPVEKFYTVQKTSVVPNGPGSYTLPAGKVISSVGYDIARLVTFGVPLIETDRTSTPIRAKVDETAAPITD